MTLRHHILGTGSRHGPVPSAAVHRGGDPALGACRALKSRTEALAEDVRRMSVALDPGSYLLESAGGLPLACLKEEGSL